MENQKESFNKELVKQIPWYWRYIPFLGNEMACCIFGEIYFPKDLYNNLVSQNPDILTLSILVHEQTHLRRQGNLGVLRWNSYYLFSKKFRLNEELVAIEKQMKFLKEHNHVYNIERKAKQFASSAYLWVMKEKEAREVLEELWGRI